MTRPPGPRVRGRAFVRRVFWRTVLATVAALGATLGVGALEERIAQVLWPIAVVVITAAATTHLLAADEERKARTTPITALLVGCLGPVIAAVLAFGPRGEDLWLLLAVALVAGVGSLALMGQIGVWLARYCWRLSMLARPTSAAPRAGI